MSGLGISHIMLVEDSPTQATRMRYVLEAEGWRVTWVMSPQEAFVKLAEDKPDLVLLDFYLPGMRGDEVCRRIRRNIDTRNLPVVMLTSEDTSDAELRGLDSGADDFIAKSVDPELLIARLRNFLGRVSKQSEILTDAVASFRSPRLLAIDDSRTFLARLRIELESEGYEVETTDDPQHGVDRISKGGFDGVLVDLMMPRMDGFEVCRHIDVLRKQMEAPPVTVILTGRESKEDQTRALEAGADDFIGKSSDVSVLKGRIRALLRRKFFELENRRILDELRQKELVAVRERAAKEAAEARASLVEELEKTAAELRRSESALQQANEAKDRFLAVLSHELRTPLTPVLATVSMRQDDARLPQELRDELSMIKRNVELEARLIDDLLDLTRITSGKLEIRCAAVDMRGLVEHAMAICQAPDASAAAPISFEFEAKDRFAWGDASRLTQIVWNLLRNAVKFTPVDGRIEVRCFNEGGEDGEIVVEVKDTGIGIEPELLPEIFNAFEQGGRKVTREYGGLGLGLAISEAIAEAHEGKLTAQSAGKNHGATFRLALPVYRGDQIAEAGTAGSERFEQSDNKGKVSAEGLRILLVEDHGDTAKALTMLLKRRGHTVNAVDTVGEAGKVAGEGEFDLLISDLSLPDGTGYEVFEKVMEQQKIPAIALSGFGMEEDVQRSKSAGFVDHLTKPVSIAALAAAIERLFPVR
ncbi:response regulator [Phragmitibacter flavus]|uniref:histidine kinase n=1 Tax=Phragmitibacter flavus TaxID=2576071 RepID=A0A5R8KA88_9BACT|nr:response regulator [Phragmitibacter flavus]TLD68825.1 response regulator [Phragmitibacter flavus]